MSTSTQESPSVDVFVSYAREDLHFVRKLTDALRASGRSVWVDLEGLYAGEAWWPNLCRAIDAANTVVFVLSPASARSAPCQAELDHATKHGKRIVPLAWSDPGDDELPAVLKETHWLVLQPDADLHVTVQALIAVLDSDPVWVRGHTRWLQFALDWDRRGRLDALLLRGEYLDEARRWLATDSPSRNPASIPVQHELIAASERADLLNRARTELAEGRNSRALATLLRAAEAGTQALGATGHAMLFEALQRLRSCEPLHSAEHSSENLALDRKGRRLVAGDQSRASIWDLTSRPAERLAVVDALDVSLPLLSPSGDRLLAGGNGRKGLLDTTTGEMIAPVEFDDESQFIAAFSSDGRWFAVGNGSSIRLFSAEDGRLIQERDQGRTVGVNNVSFNPDGTGLLTTSPERVRIWKLETLELLWSADSGTRSAFWSAHFSTKGEWVIAARGNSRITIWRSDDGSVAATLTGSKGDEFQKAWFVDEDRMIVAFDRSDMRCWKWPEGKGRGRDVRGGRVVAISPRGADVAVSSGDRSGRIVLRNLQTGELTATLGRHTDSVTALSWTPDGERLVSGDQRGLLVLWAMSTHSVHGTVSTAGGLIGRLREIPDGSGVVAACDGLRVWRFDASLALRRLEGPLRAVCVLPTAGLTVAIRQDDRTASLRDGNAEQVRDPFIEGLTNVRTCRLSPDGRWLAAIGQDDVLSLIDIATLKRVYTWPAEDTIRLAFDAAGRRLLASSSEVCVVWDIESEVALLKLGHDLLSAHTSALSPDGRRVCIAETSYTRAGQVRTAVGYGARIIDVDSGRTLARIQWGDDQDWHRYSCLSFALDGGTILLRRDVDGAVALVDATSGTVVRTFGNEESRFSFAAWSADGSAVITSDWESVDVWNANDGVRITRLGEQANVRQITFSHDGMLAATIGSHAVWLWDCATWTPLVNLCDGIDRFPQTAVFSADSQGLIIIEGDGQAAWYPVGREALCEAARPWAGLESYS